jgi:hypothetical protein
MTDFASADTPLAVDRADRTRSADGGVALRLTGRWLHPPAIDQTEPLLVIQVQGRRHRFAASPNGDGPAEQGTWEATFHLPSWAEPEREGQAALWVGTAVVPVPLGRSAARAWPPPPTPPVPGAGEMLRPGESPEPTVDTGRTGPLAELLFKESVAALHAELEQRSTDVARLQGQLADAQSELEARTAMQSALEAAHGDLRGQLQELMSAVSVQREDFQKRLATSEDRRGGAEAERDRLRDELEAERRRAGEVSSLRDQLAAAQVSRDAAIGEVAGLRAELERLGSELAVTREHHQAQGGDLGEAQRLLAEARSLSEQLRAQSSH